MVLEIVFLTLIFKDKKYEDKYILLLCLSLTLLIQYNQMFSSLGELTCKRMPFQLCNIGSYLMLITLLTKNERLYQFNLIINVVLFFIIVGIAYAWMVTDSSDGEIVRYNRKLIISSICTSLTQAYVNIK